MPYNINFNWIEGDSLVINPDYSDQSKPIVFNSTGVYQIDEPQDYTKGFMIDRWCVISSVLNPIDENGFYTFEKGGNTKKCPTTVKKKIQIDKNFSLLQNLIIRQINSYDVTESLKHEKRSLYSQKYSTSIDECIKGGIRNTDLLSALKKLKSKLDYLLDATEFPEKTIIKNPMQDRPSKPTSEYNQ